MIAHDVVASTNSGYCATVLANFVHCYCKSSATSTPLVLSYLALPIVLSEELTSTFEGCNSRTGLLAWLERSPQIYYRLASRITPCREICTAAIRFSCLSKTLRLDEVGGLSPYKTTPPDAGKIFSVKAPLERARMLGTWFASCGSARTVFESLGVKP